MWQNSKPSLSLYKKYFFIIISPANGDCILSSRLFIDSIRRLSINSSSLEFNGMAPELFFCEAAKTGNKTITAIKTEPLFILS